ncbi:phage/plasmid primase, P4 family [Rhizobium ruizarguesonis]|nr:hypothetical protein [Rhizobium leguminosarum bv. viciae]
MMARKRGADVDVGMPSAIIEIMAQAEAQRAAVHRRALEINNVHHPDPIDVLPTDPEPEGPQLSASEILEECAAEPETDIGNARRLLTRYGERILFVPRVGWHVFDGARFKEDDDGSGIRPLAHRTAEFIDDEAILLDATDDEKAKIEAGNLALEEIKKLPKNKQKWTADEIERHGRLEADVEAMRRANKDRLGRRSSRHSHAKSAAGTTKINNMLTEAAAYCARMASSLNADLYAVNTRSGTLRFLRVEGQWTVRLDRHTSKDYITKLAPVGFDVDRGCPVFERFFREVMPSEEMRKFLQRFMGYCLLGLVTEHCLLFFYGTGRNGKSTFAELMVDVLGDYAVTMSIDSFAGDQQRKGSDATPDLARLPGVRLVTAEEPEQGIRLRSALIKKMTGGTKMEVRKLQQEFFEFMPQFKIILQGNHKPIITDDSDGMWARIPLIPWDVQIAKDQIDRDLPLKLRREKDGIFAWMVRGALDYLGQGLKPPQEVISATEEYRQDSDPIGNFLRSACVISGHNDERMTPAELHEAYVVYAKQNGLPEFHSPTFTRRLGDQAKKDWIVPEGGTKRFWRLRSNGGTYYCGIRLATPSRPPDYRATSHGDDEAFPEEF